MESDTGGNSFVDDPLALRDQVGCKSTGEIISRATGQGQLIDRLVRSEGRCQRESERGRGWEGQGRSGKVGGPIKGMCALGNEDENKTGKDQDYQIARLPGLPEDPDRPLRWMGLVFASEDG